MERCIDLCQDCHALCIQTIRHCLELGGRHAMPEHIRLLEDCAEICETSANYMLRGSSFHDRMCNLCAEVCRYCADSCGHVAAEDHKIKQCADLCRRCAGSCERMGPRAEA
jgi:hypothetical protein